LKQKSVPLSAEQLVEAQEIGQNNFLSETNNTFTGARGQGAAAALVGAGVAGAAGYFATPMALNKALGEEEKVEPAVVKPDDKNKPKLDKDGKPIVDDKNKPKLDKDGKPIVAPKLDADGKPIVDTAEDKQDETDPKADTDSTDEGIGGWAIFFIILACLAVVGGLVYFFFFMPKDEDEEFDAEAQDEQNEL